MYFYSKIGREQTENNSSNEWLKPTRVTSHTVHHAPQAGLTTVLSVGQDHGTKTVCPRFQFGAEQHFQVTLESFISSHD